MGLTGSSDRSYWRTFSTILLVAGAVALGAAVWAFSNEASDNKNDPVRRVYFVRMTYLVVVLLAVTVVLLAMRGARWISARFKPRAKVEPTCGKSVWEEAGRRFELPPDEQIEDDQSSSEA